MKLGPIIPWGRSARRFIGLDVCLSVMQVLHEDWPTPNTALAATGEICRGRGSDARRSALLRLSQRRAGANALTLRLY